MNAQYDSLLTAFVQRANTLSTPAGITELDSLLRTTDKDSLLFCRTIGGIEKPFGDPNSPYRNQELYIELLEAKVASPWYESAAKGKAKMELHLRTQNRVGSTANDFTYLTPEGTKHRLSQLQSPFVLLYFNNPECDACQEMKAALLQSTIIQTKLKSGELKLLSVYIDKDETIWRKHLPEMPPTWMNVRDENDYLYQHQVYDLRAIPTLYLLDKDKLVLLNDCLDVTMIERKLSARGPNLADLLFIVHCLPW